MDKDTISLTEQTTSQLPALHLLQTLGYRYLTPAEALKLRGGRLRNVLLEDVLIPWLRENNAISYKGQTVPFSEGNIHSAVEALRSTSTENFIKTNEAVYDLLTLGKALPQSIEGDLRSFTLQYINWAEPEKNVYHVTEEFAVERAGSTHTRRPDLVLFVNGIPLAVIECKSSGIKEPMKQVISQIIRNQKEDHIPRLFHYAQLVLGVCGNDARYATAGTKAEHWSLWRETEETDAFEARVRKAVNTPLDDHQINALVQASRDQNMGYRVSFIRNELNQRRAVTAQDRAIAALCTPARLLRLTERYIVFDVAVKKIARYQQFFTVERILKRIQVRAADGKRTGGVVWHTQGSGKSLTMVMLAKGIAMMGLADHKIVLVSDRIDLDDQLQSTFQSTGVVIERANTGTELASLLASPRSQVISTVINKFEAAVAKGKPIQNANIFVLVDEGHRTQYGKFHARMQQVLPLACYIGFTGTPVMKKNKNTVDKFGGIIPPIYTITQAVDDKAVVPILYEGRHVYQKVDQEALDTWFERETAQISEEQEGYLKQRMASADQLSQAQQKVREIAYDISVHYRDNWQGTGFKGQLVAHNKANALQYKLALDAIGMVDAAVLISPPDEREGETDIYKENEDAVQRFWKEMMARYGNEKAYNKALIDGHKHGESPEIIIVVDKLLTGYDAPANTVMYLTRKLRDHTLLQAIARVNRLHEGKEYGYVIDYRGVLGALSEALDLYAGLEDFDREDLDGIMTDVGVEVGRLKELHTLLWDTFKTIANKQDVEEYEQMLADPELRDKFYDRLTNYSKTLAIALATAAFLDETPDADVQRYEGDLKFFTRLRVSVRRRYGETLDFAEYEPKIKKLIDTHVGTEATEQITPLVNIFDQEAFAEEVDKLTSVSAKADTIAHRTKKTIYERMDEDPAFYRRFSQLLQDVIDAYRQQRIDEAKYLHDVTEIMQSVVNRTGDDIPEALEGRDVAKAYFGVVKETFEEAMPDADDAAYANMAVAVDKIIEQNLIVQWTDNVDVQNRMKTQIEDWLFEYAEEAGFELDFELVDQILEKCIDIAKARKADV